MGVDRINYIKEKWSVLDYAHDVLGLPVMKSGDRCMSFTPGPHKTNNAFVAYQDWWYDFSAGVGGDVIDLCAIAKYDGNLGAAINDLAGDYGIDSHWVDYTKELNSKIAYFHEQLRESDLEYLSRRRIKKETVDRLRIGYDEKEDRLIIPYYKNGYVAYYCGRDRSGKPDAAKYKKAYLDGYNENIAWGLHTLEPKHESLLNKKYKNVLVITEGAFDALSFEQEGFKVLSPISGYFNKNTLKQVTSIAQTVDKVFICFDSDNAGTKFQVNMCQILFKNRIKFICGHLPDGIKDVSDYYAAGGDLAALVDKAKNGIEVLAKSITNDEEFEDFIYKTARFVKEPELVKLFVNIKQFDREWLDALKKSALKPPSEDIISTEIENKFTLKYIENMGFYEYQHGLWTKRSDNHIKGYVSNALGRFTGGSKLRNILDVLKSDLTREEQFNKQDIFNFQNGVLDLKTGEFMEHNPAFMSSVQVPYQYDEKAECPLWRKFISEIMANDKLAMDLLQEITGYVLFSDCSLQKGFFLIGDGANGKSVFLSILKSVFGEGNVSTVEMSGLVEPFQRIILANSLLNISTETSSDVNGAESIFKQIISGDMINGCYKNKDFVNFSPRSKMFSACNEFPPVKDDTKGLLRRICFVKFPVTFEGDKADKDLISKLKTELSGIFNWTYEGYKKLKQTKEFTVTTYQQEIMEDFVKVINPVAAFIDEVIRTKRGTYSRETVYREYTQWCLEAGHKAQSRTKFIQNFRKTIAQIMPEVIEKKSGSNRYFEFGEYPEWANLPQ